MRVETLGELELISYIEQMEGGDKNIMLIDSRTPDWVEKGTIPGAINVSWTALTPAKGATTEGITGVMTAQFNVGLKGDVDEIAIDEAITGDSVSDVFDYANANPRSIKPTEACCSIYWNYVIH